MSDTFMNNEPDNRDLGTQGDKDRLSGKAKEIGGKVQEGAGKMTGNDSMEAEGKMKQAGGNVQQGAGKAERKVNDVVDDITE